MAISVVNNTWAIDEIITDSIYTKKLKTAGTFLDKNINITLVPKNGSIELSSVSNTEQKITVINDDMYAIQAKSTITVTPTVTKGWIESAENKEFVSENTIYLNKTKLESELLEDTSKPSGSSYYRVSATQGYNEDKLTKDINVFQGDINF